MPDFFNSMAAYMKDGGGFDRHVQIINSTNFSSIEKTQQFILENVVLLAVLSLPLGKTNKDGLTARHSALFLKNFPVHAVLTTYNNGLVHELYDEEVMNVRSKISHLYTDAEENPWKQLLKVNLPETPLVRSLLNGDLKAFQRDWQILLAGPARDLFALLHSTGENGETSFHYAAEFRPKHLQGINVEDLTPEQSKEITHAHKILSSSLQDLFEFFPPSVKDGRYFPGEEQAEDLIQLSGKNKLYIGAMGIASLIGFAVTISNVDALTSLAAGVFTGIVAKRAISCYNSFKESKSASKNKEQ